MLEFYIEGQTLVVDELKAANDLLSICSTPHNYDVVWKSESMPYMQINRAYKKGDILLIDEIVHELYGTRLVIPDSDKYIVEAIEKNKTIDNVLQLIDFLSIRNFNKGNKLIVVGGGIIQDIGAYVGASYKRGIPWVLFPTTLLSMCDSCIGGKTGINFKDVKNQLALFSSPSKVYILPKFLDTLNEEDIKSGLGEVLKLFATGGEYFVNEYANRVKNGKCSRNDYQFLIMTSLLIKKAVVEKDEFEKDIRKSLNYGHTVGHIIESLSNYLISHGQAVAMGMIIINKFSEFDNHPQGKLLEKLCFDLVEPHKWNFINPKLLEDKLRNDKKVIGDQVVFVSLASLGDTRFITKTINSENVIKLVDILESQIIG